MQKVKTLIKKYRKAFFLVSILFFTSCSKVGLLNKKNSLVLESINSIGDFFKVYIVLQVSMLLFAMFMSVLVGKAAYKISLVLHFIWIVFARDYGFFNVLFLFLLLPSVLYLINIIGGNWNRRI